MIVMSVAPGRRHANGDYLTFGSDSVSGGDGTLQNGFPCARFLNPCGQMHGFVDGCWCQVVDCELPCNAPDCFAFADGAAFLFILMRDSCADAVAIDETRNRSAIDKLCWPGTLFRAWRVVTVRLMSVPVALDLQAKLIVRAAPVAMIAGNKILDRARHLHYCKSLRRMRAANTEASHAATTMPMTALAVNQ